jgi:hypothetical protein
MTKYVLHGGKEAASSEANTKFFQEVLSGVGQEPNLLCVYFAKDKNLKVWDWEQLFADDVEQITASCPGTKITFVLADDNPAYFADQIKAADVIFLRGGITAALVRVLTEIRDLETLWRGKVVAGASAGALALSAYYYDGDSGSYCEGLGILPIKVICHWGPQRFDKLDPLKRFGKEGMEVVTIPEQEFVVFEK